MKRKGIKSMWGLKDNLCTGWRSFTTYKRIYKEFSFAGFLLWCFWPVVKLVERFQLAISAGIMIYVVGLLILAEIRLLSDNIIVEISKSVSSSNSLVQKARPLTDCFGDKYTVVGNTGIPGSAYSSKYGLLWPNIHEYKIGYSEFVYLNSASSIDSLSFNLKADAE